MFTGIISATAKVRSVRKLAGGIELACHKPAGWKVRAGESVSVNGACSTVWKSGPVLRFQYMPETILRTNLGSLKAGDILNLERPLRPTDRLDGHIVQGHVDTAGIIRKISSEGNSKVLAIRLAGRERNIRLVAEKGSIAVEGISLTVTRVERDSFTVKIIPHTWKHTNLNARKAGDAVNVEFDIIAKYLERLAGGA